MDRVLGVYWVVKESRKVEMTMIEGQNEGMRLCLVQPHMHLSDFTNLKEEMFAIPEGTLKNFILEMNNLYIPYVRRKEPIYLKETVHVWGFNKDLGCDYHPQEMCDRWDFSPNTLAVITDEWEVVDFSEEDDTERIVLSMVADSHNKKYLWSYIPLDILEKFPGLDSSKFLVPKEKMADFFHQITKADRQFVVRCRISSELLEMEVVDDPSNFSHSRKIVDRFHSIVFPSREKIYSSKRKSFKPEIPEENRCKRMVWKGTSRQKRCSQMRWKGEMCKRHYKSTYPHGKY
jgi:hypothetical protein